ncbi:MAG: Stk1 family PASTA domain-containing Ser/Thr kinase [Erysipelothrix sp.]|nr:Stk1 family PASTA domain-containing Ser/Thr kinase [Erysipelothrix sp.]
MEQNELQLQRYQIIERIGEGGMANVYLAFDKVLKRECAIKILKADLSDNPVTLLRFKREADAASKLHHPSIVTIYDVGQSDNRHFIVMEYVKGTTLKSLIQQRGAIEKNEAIFLMEQILEGIVVAHKAGVIHRDIKPQNILIKADGTVKITDFGIATTEGSVQLTQHDSVMGSVHYLAPECARGEQATSQSDIYSLGIVFYEMLTGEVPYKGDGAVQVALKHLNDEIRPVREFNNSIEQSIENIIIKATAKNRSFRYQSAQDMLDDLKVALSDDYKNVSKVVFKSTDEGETLVFDEIDAKKTSKVSKNPKEKRKKQILIGVIIACVVIIAAIFAIDYFGGNGDPAMVKIPPTEGLSIEEATELLEEAGFEVSERVTYELHEDIEKDLVIRTNPEVDEEAAEGSLIRLIVSEGTFLVIEDYTGWLESDVRALFENTRVTIRVEYAAESSREPGVVLSQELLNPGDKVDPSISYEMKLIVSKPVEFVIPDVIGSPIESAKAIIESRGGVVTLIPQNSDTLTDEEFVQISFETVIEVNPTVGSRYVQEEGNTVELKYWEKTDRVVVDRTMLVAMIERYDQINTTEAPAEMVNRLELAYENATRVNNKKTATQTEVDSVAQALSVAIQDIVNYVPEPEPSGNGS